MTTESTPEPQVKRYHSDMSKPGEGLFYAGAFVLVFGVPVLAAALLWKVATKKSRRGRR